MLKIQNFWCDKKSWMTLIIFFLLLHWQLPQAHAHTIKKMDEISLMEAIHLISRKYQVFFNYDRAWVSNVTVSYSPDGAKSLEEDLAFVMGQTDLKYRIFDDQYVAVYRDNEAGLISLQKMIEHFQHILDEKRTRRKSTVIPISRLRTYTSLEMYNRKLVLNISGAVTDQSGLPLIGVNVLVKGTNKGTATDIDGNFSLQDVDEQAVLVVSYVGYQTKEVPVAGKSTINISLTEDLQTLDEVVVVGYGTQKKSDIVGSVSSVSAERLEQSKDPSIFQALQGVVPGLNIQRNNGEPGSSGNILIRGVNSISASNNPLIVVDGIPFAGNIRDINPNDIASIEVLKDASASAIYGSRAANGVILVTSKSGSSNGTQISLNANWSIQNEAVPYPVMDPEQFYETREWAWRLDGLLDGVSDVDVPATILENNEFKSYEKGETVNWMDEMINENALRQEYQLSVSTGNESIKDYFSVSYLDEAGLEASTGFNRINLQNNLELLSLADWLKIGNNTSLSINDFQRRATGGTGSSAYYRLSPYGRIFEDDGTYTEYPMANDALLGNPIAENTLTTKQNKFQNLFNAFYLTIAPEFLPGLSYTMRLGTTFRNNFSGVYYPKGTAIGNSLNGSGEVNKSELRELTWENILNYQKNFGDHNLGLTGLFSRQNSRFEGSSSAASGFVSDKYLWYNLGGGSVVGAPSSSLNEWDLVSYMARMMYNYKNKYYITATGRQDGYSGFGEGNKYGFFPSFAIAWRLSGQRFMQHASWIDDLKFRVSYGSVGNQAVGTYRSLARLTNAQPVFGETLFPGVRVSSLANPNLGWETTSSMNFALDFITLGGRLSGNIEYYNSRTDDILLNRQIPKISGQNDITFNIGKVRNQGVELALNTIPVDAGNFTWKLDVVFSNNQNEILELYGDTQDDIANQWFIGEPLDIIYDYEFGGIWQSGQEDMIAQSATPDRLPGDAIIVDQNNDNKINSDDRKIVGYQQPKWIGGINTSVAYKGLNLSVFLQSVQGQDRNVTNVNNERFGRVNDIPFDFWTPDNPSNEWVRPGINHGVYYGSMNVFDASFTRVKDITLYYDLPSRVLNTIALQKIGLYVNLHDYFTVTRFPWIDPESAATYQISIPKYVQLGLNITL